MLVDNFRLHQMYDGLRYVDGRGVQHKINLVLKADVLNGAFAAEWHLGKTLHKFEFDLKLLKYLLKTLCDFAYSPYRMGKAI